MGKLSSRARIGLGAAVLVVVLVVVSVLVLRPGAALGDDDVRSLQAQILDRVKGDAVTSVVIDDTQVEGEWAIASVHFVGAYLGGGEGGLILGRLIGGKWSFALPGDQLFLTWLTILPRTLLSGYITFIQHLYASPPPAPPATSAVVFRFPFSPAKQYRLQVGPGGKLTGDGDPSRNAYVYAMAEGDDVLAAADGEIVVAYDGSTVSGCTQKAFDAANRIVIRHADGTETLYMHIATGSIVKRSGPVKAGDVIARAGRTGWVCPAGDETIGLRVQRQRGATSESWLQASLPLTYGGPQLPVGTVSTAPSPTPTPTPTPTPSPSPSASASPSAAPSPIGSPSSGPTSVPEPTAAPTSAASAAPTTAPATPVATTAPPAAPSTPLPATPVPATPSPTPTPTPFVGDRAAYAGHEVATGGAPKPITRGTSATYFVLYNNTGTTTWVAGTSSAIGLQATSAQPPAGLSYVPTGTIGTVSQASVAPGQNAFIQITITVPSSAALGTYTIVVRPVVRGVVIGDDGTAVFNVQ